MLSNPSMIVPECIVLLGSSLERDIISGTYESAEISVARKVFGSGDVVLDIGSGVGVTAFSLLNAGVGYVYCYEANSKLVAFSRLLLEANGCEACSVVNAAIVPRKLTPNVDFFIRDPLMTSSLDGSIGEYVARETVPACLLDEVILKSGANAILCDIEGAEAEVLAGANLVGIKKIVVELHVHKSGVEAVISMFRRLTDLCFVYDQWYSSGRVLAFRHSSIYFDDYFSAVGESRRPQRLQART